MNVRLSAVVGVALGVLGIAALAAPGLTTGLPTDDALVTVLGAVLVLGGFREVQRRRSTDPSYAETADTEQAIELPTPGADFDDRLAAFSAQLYNAAERDRLRSQLADVAVATLRRRFDYAADEARAALDDRTWTDDPVAAALFSGTEPGDGPLDRVRSMFRPDAAFTRRARHAVDELYRIAEGEREDADE